MKRLTASILPIFIGIVTLSAQNLDTSVREMTLARAHKIMPRSMEATVSGPVKSLIPQDSIAADTLDTGNPLIKIVLLNNGTWKYIKDGDLLKSNTYFTECWNEHADAYKMDYAELPDRTTLWLVDNASQFCCPYSTKVYSPFGYRHGRRHQGVDLPLKVGDPIRATFDGKVRISKYMKGYGNLIVLRHENGLETFYGHLSKRNVNEGDWVAAGQIIGNGGSTGRSTGPHLHFETRYKGYAFDPQWLIDFEQGTLRNGVFTLRKKHLSASSRYVHESDDEEEEILKAEDKYRAEEAAKRYHVIKEGDTLGRIAARNHTTVNAICRLNNITPTTVLRIGRKLRVN